MSSCLYCYQPLTGKEQDYHLPCAKKIFGIGPIPHLDFKESDMAAIGTQIINSNIAVTGVQPKLSLAINKVDKDNTVKRFTIVGPGGDYILKPPSDHYHQLPEVEDLSMHLAAIAKIKTVPHSLIRLQSGNLAYITKRIDRVKGGKLHMEDMCQVTERLTENKYHGSYEQIAKAIQQYSVNPGLDIINFWEQVVFSFLIGNADMHLKNFSLIKLTEQGYTLAAAYDMVATVLVNPADDEDMALTLNGKKKKLKRKDFDAAFLSLNLTEKQQENIYKKMMSVKSNRIKSISISFLDKKFKDAYKQLIVERFSRLELD